MEYITNNKDFQLNNTVVTIGKFDCFHKGHQLLFDIAASLKTGDMKQVIFSFYTNPQDVVNNAVGKHVISQQERHFYAVKNGVDYFIEYPFDSETRHMSPEEFARDILVGKLGAQAVVAGDDFCFGKDRAGNVEVLKNLGMQYGFDVRIVDRISYNGEIISSTYIKDELIKGHLDDVCAMLGRPYTMAAIVGHGSHIGTGMGVPTINFQVPEDKLLPPDGVYITKTQLDGEIFQSITNVGVRPTFYDDGARCVETNILGFSGDAYEKKAVVSFYKFIRPEKKFETKEQLIAQIQSDLDKVVTYFSYGKENVNNIADN